MIKNLIEKKEKSLMGSNRPFTEFQSKDEYVQAMVEDLSDWLNYLYNLQGEDQLTSDNFFRHLKNGVILCKHAQVVQTLAESYLKSSNIKNRTLPLKIGNNYLKVPLVPPSCTIVDFSKKINTFHERDNVSNFILWCKHLNIPESLTFETEDLVKNKNSRHVVVALLELSRIGQLFGMEVPDLIQLEQEIEDEINDIKVTKKNIDVYDGRNNYKNEKMFKALNYEIKDINESYYIKSNKDIINNDYDYNKSGSQSAAKNFIIQKSDTNLKNDKQHRNGKDYKNNKDKITQVKDFKKLYSKMNATRFSSSLGKDETINFKDQMIPVNGCSHDSFDKFHNNMDPKNSYNSLPNDESFDLSISLRNNSQNKVLRKCQSVYFNENRTMSAMVFDNSDNDSNFSQNSRSNFKIPKHFTAKPIGRVKIYDNFNNLNIKKERKIRETVDLQSLDEKVREILSQCQCKEMFPMKRISEGKYQYGDNSTNIFVRILRSHVMVRVGGGWETLGDFFLKHDSCRKAKNNNKLCLPILNKKPQAESPRQDTIVIFNSKTVSNNLDSREGMEEPEKLLENCLPSFSKGIENSTITRNNYFTEFSFDKENSNSSKDLTGTQLKVEEITIPKENNNNVNIRSNLQSDVPFSDNIDNLSKTPVIKEPLPIRSTSFSNIRNKKMLSSNFDTKLTEKNRLKQQIILADKFEIKKSIPKMSINLFHKKK